MLEKPRIGQESIHETTFLLHMDTGFSGSSTPSFKRFCWRGEANFMPEVAFASFDVFCRIESGKYAG
jgi:hypothetical protein